MAISDIHTWIIRNRQTLFIAAILIALYGLPLAGAAPATNPNEVARIESAVSLALWATFDLRDTVAVYGLSEDVSIRDGKIFSDKAPGLSFAAAPVVWLVSPFLPRAPSSDIPDYWPLRHVLTLLLVALPTVGLSLLVGAAVPHTNPRHLQRYAVIAALATPLWTYGTVFFGHAPAALLISLAWFLVLGFPGRPLRIGVGRAFLGGTAAGLAVTTEYPTVLLVGIIFTTLLVRRTAIPVLGGAAAGMVIGILPALVYHQVAFGAPWITGYALKAHGDFQAIHQRGFLGISIPTVDALWGVLFSVRRGILFYCPLLLLAPIGLWRLVRDRGWRDAGPIVAGCLVYVLFAAGFVDWTAGWCAAARHLVPIIPLTVVVALHAVSGLTERRLGRVIVVVLVAFSGTNAVLSIGLTPFFPPEFSAPFAQLVLPTLMEGIGFSNILTVTLGTTPVAVVLLTGAIAVAVLTWAGSSLLREQKSSVAAVSIATVVVILLSYSWFGYGPSNDIELLRAQMLRRLGHSTAADRIEATLISDPRSRSEDLNPFWRECHQSAKGPWPAFCRDRRAAFRVQQRVHPGPILTAVEPRAFRFAHPVVSPQFLPPGRHSPTLRFAPRGL